LGVPTIFNLLGPLTNPAGAKFQVVGVGRKEIRPLLAEALRVLDAKHAVVVHGQDGLDEVTLSGPTEVTEIDGETLREFEWTPEDFGLRRQKLDALRIDGPAASAAMIREVLDGKPGAARDITVLNAAAGLWTAGHDPDLRRCATAAAEAIDSGAAARLLASLARLSGA
jgi:anthranilate phosphoribosyltransferase